MTPTEFKAIRHSLGLSAQGLADALGLGASSGRTVRRWEAGGRDIPGPVRVLMLIWQRNAAILDAAILDHVASPSASPSLRSLLVKP